MPSSAFSNIVWDSDLKCGCKLGTNHRTMELIYVPCSQTCKWYKFIHEETERQGKPLKVIKK